MAEYIDREAVLRDWPLCDEPADAYQFIRGFPATDVMERKTGKWLIYDPDANVYECSICHDLLTLYEGTPKENNFNFCPFCGLLMSGGDDDA